MLATTSAVATAPRAVSQAHPKADSGAPGPDAEEGTRRPTSRSTSAVGLSTTDRGGRGRPSAPRPARPGRRSTPTSPARDARSLVLRDPVPHRNPPADPPGRQPMLDLVGTKPLGRTGVGGPAVGVLLDAETERHQRIQIASALARGPGPARPEERNRRRGAEPLEKRDVQARSRR